MFVVLKLKWNLQYFQLKADNLVKIIFIGVMDKKETNKVSYIILDYKG